MTTEERELAEGMNRGLVFKRNGHSRVMEMKEGRVFTCALRSGYDQNDSSAYLWKYLCPYRLALSAFYLYSRLP